MKCRGTKAFVVGMTPGFGMNRPVTIPMSCKESATLFWRVRFSYDIRMRGALEGYVTALCADCDSIRRSDVGDQWIAISEAEAERELAVRDVHES
jgi:RNase P subunit RPR2